MARIRRGKSPKYKAEGLHVTEFMEPDFLEDALTELNTEFSGWQETDGRGTRQLWSMLGRVYELSAKVEGNNRAKYDLVQRVQKNPSVKDNPHWDATKKKADELLIALFLGIREETKVTKSQWISALRAGQKHNIQATHGAFSTWLETVGGIKGARQSIAKVRQDKLDFPTLVEKLAALYDEQAEPISVPHPISNKNWPADLGIVIVKRIDKNTAIPIVTIQNESLLKQLIVRLLADVKSVEYKNRYYIKDITDNFLHSTWLEFYRDALKNRAFKGSFEDFMDREAPYIHPEVAEE